MSRPVPRAWIERGRRNVDDARRCHLAADPTADVAEAIDHGAFVCPACRSFGASTHRPRPAGK